MNILLVGNNRVNDHISTFFTDKGFSISSETDVYKLNSLSGETGNLIFHTNDTDLHADFVILTEQPAADPVIIDGLSTLPILNDNDIFINKEIKSPEPIVFLLDYLNESSPAAANRALIDTTVLAHKKQQVYYLARFIRTLGYKGEALYREAREAGVVFVKYDDIQVKSNITDDEFLLTVIDTDVDLLIKTKTLYSDGGWDVGERFSYAVKKLNLTPNHLGYVTEDMYFLSPVFTSRKGVFHLPRDIIAQRLDEGLNYIYAFIKNGDYNVSSENIAVIDGNKCVLCYNCYRACPHAALTPDRTLNQMTCLQLACTSCGICKTICPSAAISFDNDNKDPEQTSNVDVKTNNMLITYCNNSGGIHCKDILTSINADLSTIDLVEVKCGGSINIQQLTNRFLLHDNIVCIICPDDACRHFTGNKRACTQIKRLNDMLKASKIISKKVSIIKASQTMQEVLKDELRREF